MISGTDRDQNVSQGASAEAIRAHYDVGDEFYRLWLDRSMTYSCAMWDEGDDLFRAQMRKLDFHAMQARARGANRVLDIGCGWGSLMERLSAVHGVPQVVGLTLSESQARAVRDRELPGVEVRQEHWRKHVPTDPYDALVSIGAVEHFVTPAADEAERIAIYRDFFETCYGWLREDGWLSLQSITYGIGRFKQGVIASIFPESDLPRLSELVRASEGIFEVRALRNDRADYAATCRSWLSELRNNKAHAEKLIGNARVSNYLRFLTAAAKGFEANIFNLVRMSLRRVASK